MKSFRTDNTEGYTQDQLDNLNAEWSEIANMEELDPHTDEYSQREQEFADTVARR